MKIKRWKRMLTVLFCAVIMENSMPVTAWEVKAETTAEEPEKSIIAKFTFDDTDTGFCGAEAVAKNTGTPMLSTDAVSGNALYFDGQGSNYLVITDTNGAPLLTGSQAVTISYWSKVTASAKDVDWAFYMAPADTAQNYKQETYLGIRDSDSVVVSERYKNTGILPANAVAAEKITDWKHVTVIFDEKETKVYVNGVYQSSETSSYALPDILGENSVFYIGKANWEDGKYFVGLMDDISVYNYALTEAEISSIYAEGADILDGKSAQMVMDMINYIGNVAYDSMSRTMITLSRGAYNALTDVQKAKVTNYDILIQAETAYNALAAEAVTTAIDAIGEVTGEASCKGKIDDARVAYDTLTDAQKDCVAAEATAKLKAAETDYYTIITDEENARIIQQAIQMISLIGDVHTGEECENKILSAEKAYAELTVEQQEFVNNYSILTNARMNYDRQKQSENEAADTAAAQNVINFINRIGNVTTSEGCKAKIDAAEAAYAGLTVEQQIFVTNTDALEDAKITYAQLKAQEEAERLAAEQAAKEQAEKEQAAKDAKAAGTVMDFITEIGTVDGSTDCKVRIDVARFLYENLTDTQKALVSNKAELEAAEQIYAGLKAQKDAEEEQKANEQAKAEQEAKAAAAEKAAKEAAWAGTVTVSQSQQTITSANTDKKDVTGSTFAACKLKAKAGSTSIKLSWGQVSDADGYLIYGAACGKKMKLVKEVSAAQTKLEVKKLKRGRYYKYMVTAYKIIYGEKRTIAISKTVHACTKGGKFGNPTGISYGRSRVSIKKGGVFILTPALKADKQVQNHTAKFRYESSDPAIAVVNKSGKIKGIKQGTCFIYMYTQNGVYKKVKIIVQ